MATTTMERECTMKVEPQKEHEWLQKMVGEWTIEGEASMSPGEPLEKFEGTESVRSIEGVWVVGEGRYPDPKCGDMITISTIGYDPNKGRYVGTFFGSMMTHLWVYEGSLDASERVLTLDTEGPNFAVEGKTAKFKDVIEFKSDDHRVLKSHMQGDDGEWHVVMTADFRRKR